MLSKILVLFAFAISASASANDVSSSTNGAAAPAAQSATFSALDLTAKPETTTRVKGSDFSFSEFIDKSALSFSYRTSRTTQSISYREMMAQGGSGSGGGGESSIPNLNSVSIFAATPAAYTNRAFIGLSQNVDPAERLKIDTPMGTTIQLPAQIVAAGYTRRLSDAFNLDVKSVYMNTFGFLDPSAGLTYQARSAQGLSPMASLQLTAPTSERSRSTELVTRATLRTMDVNRIKAWSAGLGLTHTQSFYENGSPRQAARSNRVQEASVTVIPTEIDLLLVQKELMRSGAALIGGYNVSDRLNFSVAATLSRSITEKDRTLWITGLKPLVARYTLNQFEVASEVSINSDIRDFDAPRIPTQVSVGLTLAYTFGDRAALPMRSL